MLDYGIKSLVIEAGEQAGENRYDWYERTLDQITHDEEDYNKKHNTNLYSNIGLSIGEYPKRVYGRFFDKGATSYTLKIETSNPELYYSINYPAKKFEDRVKCLKYLDDIGFQLGSGTMIGIPGQSPKDIAGDIEFFKSYNIDTIEYINNIILVYHHIFHVKIHHYMKDGKVNIMYFNNIFL